MSARKTATAAKTDTAAAKTARPEFIRTALQEHSAGTAANRDYSVNLVRYNGAPAVELGFSTVRKSGKDYNRSVAFAADADVLRAAAAALLAIADSLPTALAEAEPKAAPRQAAPRQTAPAKPQTVPAAPGRRAVGTTAAAAVPAKPTAPVAPAAPVAAPAAGRRRAVARNLTSADWSTPAAPRK